MEFCALFLLSSVVAVTAGAQCTSVTCRSTGTAQTISNTTEQDTIRSIQCTLRCAENYGLMSQISIPTKGWLLYSSMLANRLDCTTYQKLRECRRGCLLSASIQNSDNCRDQCYESCHSECGGATSCSMQGLPCQQECKKPPCKQGCEEFNWTASLDSTLTPLTSPDVRSNGSTCGLYTVNVTGALPIPSTNLMGKAVGVAINVVGCGMNVFYWQSTTGDVLDMKPFLCTTATVSFALVTTYTRSQWSPALQLCYQAVQTYPSQVPAISITIRYYEDPRPAFLGYAAADITWTQPTGFQSLTSYTIQILSQQYACGGSNYLYSYNNISKDLSEFIIQARTPNGLLRFGCKYYFIFIANPTAPGRSGTFLTTTPQLPGPLPQMVIMCQKIWDTHGFFNISVSVVIANSTKPILESIAGFTFTSELVQVRNSNYVPIVMEVYGTSTLQAQSSSANYSTLLYGFKPQTSSQLFYKVQVNAVQNSAFFWRGVPQSQMCYVESSGLPPKAISTFHVHSLQYSSVRTQAIFNWNPPITTNGALVAYEICITPNLSTAMVGQSNACALTIKTAVNETALSIVGSIHTTVDPLCLYVQVRSFNEYLASDWSRKVLISSNSRCDGGSGLQPTGSEGFMYEATILIY